MVQLAAPIKVMKGYRDRPPLWKRDTLVTFNSSLPSLPSIETGESGVGDSAPAGPPNLKRKSANAAGPPDLKRRSVETSDAISPLNLTTLSDQCLVLILSKLSGRACGQAAAVCKRWSRLTSEERLWAALCRRDWGLTQPYTAELRPTSYRASYISWERSNRGYGKAAVRAKIAWAVVESWLQHNIPAIRGTLGQGATEGQLAAAEAELGVQFPPAVRALYRIHDGQHIPADAAADETGNCLLDQPSILYGLFGGYSYYDQLVSVRMLPLKRVVLWTKRLRQQVLKTSQPDQRIVFAGSFNLKKLLVVDCATGLVKACLADKSKGCSAVPQDLEEGARDGMLRWFEEYAKRLKDGQYQVMKQPATPVDLGVPVTNAICLFPMKPPVWTWAVTRGVHVHVSTVFVPENSKGTGQTPDGKEVPPRFFFAYSARLLLLSEEEQRECGVAKPLKTVQLKSRHWIIRNRKGEKMDEITGEGVIGVHPTLHAGGEAFTYQSCTPQQRLPAILHGEFTFVKGTLEDAREKGDTTFTVRIPTVVLNLPSYIY